MGTLGEDFLAEVNSLRSGYTDGVSIRRFQQGMAARTCNSSALVLRRLKQEYLEFEASLNYIVRPCFRKQQQSTKEGRE